jgi:hypothetical protein
LEKHQRELERSYKETERLKKDLQERASTMQQKQSYQEEIEIKFKQTQDQTRNVSIAVCGDMITVLISLQLEDAKRDLALKSQELDMARRELSNVLSELDKESQIHKELQLSNEILQQELDMIKATSENERKAHQHLIENLMSDTHGTLL